MSRLAAPCIEHDLEEYLAYREQTIEGENDVERGARGRL